MTAWVLRALFGDFSRFMRAKQLSRYCGSGPTNASSGKKVADAGLIDACYKTLRRRIVQTAHRLIRTTDRWGKLISSLQKWGKPRYVQSARWAIGGCAVCIMR